MKCSSCDTTDKDYLMKCQECGEYFCNKGSSCSHIVAHMKATSHMYFMVTDKEEKPMACYCGGNSLPIIGYMYETKAIMCVWCMSFFDGYENVEAYEDGVTKFVPVIVNGFVTSGLLKCDKNAPDAPCSPTYKVDERAKFDSVEDYVSTVQKNMMHQFTEEKHITKCQVHYKNVEYEFRNSECPDYVVAKCLLEVDPKNIDPYLLMSISFTSGSVKTKGVLLRKNKHYWSVLLEKEAVSSLATKGKAQLSYWPLDVLPQIALGTCSAYANMAHGAKSLQYLNGPKDAENKYPVKIELCSCEMCAPMEKPGNLFDNLLNKILANATLKTKHFDKIVAWIASSMYSATKEKITIIGADDVCLNKVTEMINQHDMREDKSHTLCLRVADAQFRKLNPTFEYFMEDVLAKTADCKDDKEARTHEVEYMGQVPILCVSQSQAINFSVSPGKHVIFAHADAIREMAVIFQVICADQIILLNEAGWKGGKGISEKGLNGSYGKRLTEIFGAETLEIEEEPVATKLEKEEKKVVEKKKTVKRMGSGGCGSHCKRC